MPVGGEPPLYGTRAAVEQPAHPVGQLVTVGGFGGDVVGGTIAVEVGSTEKEYDTKCSGGPIIAYSDALCVYDKDVADGVDEHRLDAGTVSARGAGGLRV